MSSHTTDPIGLQEAVRKADRTFRDLGMLPCEELTDERSAWTWQTKQGLDSGTLFIGHLDVPASEGIPTQMFRKEAEWLYGEGIGSSRAPLVMLEFALRALRSVRRLRGQALGVMLYTDEGRDARYSAEVIRAAAAKAARVLVLRPGPVGDSIVTRRRGQRKYRFRAEGDPRRPGQVGKTKKPEVLRWTWNQLEELCRLSDTSRRVSISALGLEVTSLPMLLPHRTDASVLLAYPDTATADEIEKAMNDSIAKGGPRWDLKKISDRPAMTERRANATLAKAIETVAKKWEINLKRESSVWPSVAGLVPPKLPCLCGIGPVARDLGTPHESVQRISLVQRTLLLAEFLLGQAVDGS